jgi:retron-type reverse transcriptase
MIAVALLVVLGVIAAAGGMYWRKLKSGPIDSIAVLPLDISQRIIRLIQKWLKAGVSEDGEWSETSKGTPQGAVVSPLIANVYLHYCFDLWADVWRRKVAKGDVIIVRYADDLAFPIQT